MSDAGARLVGRTAEVARSVEVAAGNAPEVAVLIEGAAGIGKTVVLQAAIDAAAATGALVLQTRPSEAELRMPLLGLHDLLAPVIPDAFGRSRHRSRPGSRPPSGSGSGWTPRSRRTPPMQLPAPTAVPAPTRASSGSRS